MWWISFCSDQLRRWPRCQYPDESNNPIDAFGLVGHDKTVEEGQEYDIVKDIYVDENDHNDDGTEVERKDVEEDHDKHQNDTNYNRIVLYDMHSDDNEEEIEEMRDHYHEQEEGEDDYQEE